MGFRTLRAEEIDCRVATVSADKKGCSLLLYKDARCDMNILDETVGAYNWQRHHLRDNANCVVSIYDPKKKEWISKEDTGTESNTEAEKGIASDSFKRACFNWGIGRELYTAPFIWIKGADIEWKKDSKGKDVPADRFFVRDIAYDDKKRINRLVICKGRGVVVYTFGTNVSTDQVNDTVEQAKANKPEQVICPKCGKPILKETIKGKVRTPEEILEKMGCCLTCWNEAKG